MRATGDSISITFGKCYRCSDGVLILVSDVLCMGKMIKGIKIGKPFSNQAINSLFSRIHNGTAYRKFSKKKRTTDLRF